MPVSKLMTEKVESCAPSETSNSVLERMTTGRFRHMPVVEGGKMVGLLSIGDALEERLLLEEFNEFSTVDCQYAAFNRRRRTEADVLCMYETEIQSHGSLSIIYRRATVKMRAVEYASRARLIGSITYQRWASEDFRR
jgi:hypothetical protein